MTIHHLSSHSWPMDPYSIQRRRPILARVLVEEGTCWHRLTVPGRHGTGERTVEVASDTAVWR